jgi:hypothetical protein
MCGALSRGGPRLLISCEPLAAFMLTLTQAGSNTPATLSMVHSDVMSASTVLRWLARDAIKPWQYRSRIFHRNPVPAGVCEELFAVGDGWPAVDSRTTDMKG